MDPWKAIIAKADRNARPGRNGDPGAQGFGQRAAAIGQANQYVTWSGTVATVHTRLLFGVAGHGFGSEFV